MCSVIHHFVVQEDICFIRLSTAALMFFYNKVNYMVSNVSQKTRTLLGERALLHYQLLSLLIPSSCMYPSYPRFRDMIHMFIELNRLLVQISWIKKAFTECGICKNTEMKRKVFTYKCVEPIEGELKDWETELDENVQDKSVRKCPQCLQIQHKMLWKEIYHFIHLLWIHLVLDSIVSV